MKIGIDCRLWDETGVGRYIRNLVLNLQKLDKHNNYTLFVLSKNREEILKQVQNDNFKVIESDIRWHRIDEQIKLPQILNRENLDLVHFPYFSVPIFYNRPFVVTIHDLIINHFPTGKASTLPGTIYNLKLLGYKFVIAQAAKKAKKIITVSNATKKEIVDHLKVSPEKVMVTYEGVGREITNSKSQIPNNSQNTKYSILNTQYFLYVGNAYPHKNLERLLEAFSAFCHPEASAEGSHEILRSAQNDIRLVLVGREDYFYKRLKKKVEEMNLSDKVTFLQNVNDELLTSLYKNAIALVLPSLMEGFGLPVLEAMANKCLVLVSNISSLREICSDAAIYFDPYSPKDIEEKMRKVCFNDLNHFSGKIKKGLERVELFSWSKMAKETLQVYDSLMISNKI